MKKEPQEKKKPSPPENPYMAGRQEWNERYGGYIKEALNWRRIAFASMALAAGAMGGWYHTASQQKVSTYVVETNAFGEVRNTSRVDTPARPNEKEIKAALRKWVIGARTVYVDLRAQKEFVDETYAMTLPDSPAYQNLALYHRQFDPYKRSAQETVEVNVNAVVPVSEETWQIEWTETTRQRSGKEQVTKPMQATVTLTLAPPTDDRQIMQNPLGIYVRQYSWTTRL